MSVLILILRYLLPTLRAQIYLYYEIVFTKAALYIESQYLLWRVCHKTSVCGL